MVEISNGEGAGWQTLGDPRPVSLLTGADMVGSVKFVSVVVVAKFET